MGLLTGFSILSLVEIFYFGFKFLKEFKISKQTRKVSH